LITPVDVAIDGARQVGIAELAGDCRGEKRDTTISTADT
jgi:hypothetical protein